MKFRKTTLILAAAACLLAFTVTSVSAQGMLKGYGIKDGSGSEYGIKGMHDGKGRGLGMIGILKAAGDPLTD